MKITLVNKTGSKQVVTLLDNGSLKKYGLEDLEEISIDPSEELAELECGGTIQLCPTIDEKSYVLIADQEILRGRKQLKYAYIVALIALGLITVIALSGSILLSALFIVIQILIVSGIYKILLSEQKGEVVFIER